METIIERRGKQWIFIENSEIKFIGYEKSSFLLPKTQIILINEKEELISRNISFVWNGLSSKTIFSNDEILNISYKSIFNKPYIEIKDNQTSYCREIIIHNNNKYSVFQDENTQVAFIELLNTVYYFDYESIRLLFNKNEDKLKLYSIILSTICSFDDNKFINFNFKSILRQKRKINESWNPS